MPPTRRPYEDQNTWNMAFSVFFVAVLMGVLWVIWAQQGSFPRSVPIFDAILMAFAAFRITRLVVYDKITRWFRELFVTKTQVEEGGERWVHLTPLGRGIRHTLHDLLQCPWCIGFWSALAVVFCYFVFPWGWVAILFLAVAGAGSLLQITANAIGWKAEHLKGAVLEKESEN